MNVNDNVNSKFDKEDSKYAFKYVGSVLTTLFDEPYMQKKPNSNTDFEDAMAIQTMALSNMMLSLKATLKREEIETSGVLMRTIIEIISNVNYMIKHEDKEEIAKKYLQTELRVPEMLYKVRKGLDVKPIYWADIKLMERIRLYSDEYEGINLEALYFYLFSYAHADAGFVGSYTYGHKVKLKPMLTAFIVLMTMEFMDLLKEAKVIDQNTYIKCMKLFSKKVKAMNNKNKKAT